MFFWWYAHGWHTFINKLRGFLSGITDFFSMDSLIRTLFKPFRQISAESASSSASLDLKFHMFIDRLVSRVVGFFSRLVLLFTGTIIIIFGGIVSLILIILWPIIPFLPVVGIILAVMGVPLWVLMIVLILEIFAYIWLAKKSSSALPFSPSFVIFSSYYFLSAV